MSPCVDKNDALIAAYCQASGLAAVVVMSNPDALRVAAVAAGGPGADAAEKNKAPRWWCRRLGDAERVAAAAMMRLRRSEANTASADDDSLRIAGEAIRAAAKRLNIALRSDHDVAVEAAAAILRVEEELDRLKLAGELKAVNRAYRAYRIETTARGERVLRYADWMSRYKEKLIREVAAALRYL